MQIMHLLCTLMYIPSSFHAEIISQLANLSHPNPFSVSDNRLDRCHSVAYFSGIQLVWTKLRKENMSIPHCRTKKAKRLHHLGQRYKQTTLFNTRNTFVQSTQNPMFPAKLCTSICTHPYHMYLLCVCESASNICFAN